MEYRRIRDGICLCVGDLFRTVHCGDSNVVQNNNATILRSVKITARQDDSTMFPRNMPWIVHSICVSSSSSFSISPNLFLALVAHFTAAATFEKLGTDSGTASLNISVYRVQAPSPNTFDSLHDPQVAHTDFL
jgi:hypothetical protein